VEMTPEEAAAAVERYDCPTCEAMAPSPCRTCGGKVASKYHTARFILVPALRDLLEVPVPEDVGPARPGTATTGNDHNLSLQCQGRYEAATPRKFLTF